MLNTGTGKLKLFDSFKTTTFYICCLLLCAPLALPAQKTTRPDSMPGNTTTLTKEFNGAEIVLRTAQTLPEYPGGKDAWREFLHTRLNPAVPLIYKAQPGKYQVIIRFTIDKNGMIKNIGAESNCEHGMKNEVIRCIRQSLAWNPGLTKNGEKVSIATRQIVYFLVESQDCKIKIL